MGFVADQGTTKRGLDYYGALGLTKGATQKEIRDAYKELGLQYNPSRYKCGGGDSKLYTLFALVGEAYEVLSDPILKALYDQFGEAGLKKGVMTVLGWYPPWHYHADPLQTFKKFFGTSNPYADIVYCMQELLNSMRTSDLETKVKQPPLERNLELTLEEIFFGTMKKIKIQRRVYDKDQVTTIPEEKVLCVQVRPGLPEGTKIVYKEVGDEGPKIIPGDLIITTQDAPHKRFRRKGSDLLMAVTLELHRALGDLTIELTTLDCRVIRFAITDIITAGYTKTIKGEGMPYVDDIMKKGDLIITFDVVFPKYLTEAARRKIVEAILSSGSPEEDGNSPEVIQMLLNAQKLKKVKNPSGSIKPARVSEKEEGEDQEVDRCEDFLDINKEKYTKI